MKVLYVLEMIHITICYNSIIFFKLCCNYQVLVNVLLWEFLWPLGLECFSCFSGNFLIISIIIILLCIHELNIYFNFMRLFKINYAFFSYIYIYSPEKPAFSFQRSLVFNSPELHLPELLLSH